MALRTQLILMEVDFLPGLQILKTLFKDDGIGMNTDQPLRVLSHDSDDRKTGQRKKMKMRHRLIEERRASAHHVADELPG